MFLLLFFSFSLFVANSLWMGEIITIVTITLLSGGRILRGHDHVIITWWEEPPAYDIPLLPRAFGWINGFLATLVALHFTLVSE